MNVRCSDIVWDYVRPSSSFHNAGTYAPPSTPRVHAFPAVPRTEPADWKMQPPVGGIGMDICKGRQNPYQGGMASFDRRFTYLREGGHQVSRSPGPGNYETRHLTGGALVKHPSTASPCFRRPGGRLNFGHGGTWHEETPLESAERHGTVRGSLKTQPQHYSLSFRSKADRLVVNKPSNTTHEGVGPGCYDLSKDGKSVGVKTEKRVGRRGSEGRGPTNQYLVDWRAYMKRPPTANDGYGGSGGVGDGGRGSPRGKAEPSPQSAPHGPPETPKTVSYALTRQSESWAAARNWPRVAAAGRAGKEEVETGGSRETGQRSHQEARSRQHRHSEQEMETFFPQEQGRGQGQPQQQQQQRPQQQQQQQHKAGDLMRRAKRPASAVASVRIPSATAAETHALPRRRYGLPRRGRNSNGKISSGRGGGAGGSSRSVTSAIFSETGSCSAVSTSTASGFGPPQFVPRPPSVDTACRPRATGSARVERVSSQYADTCVDSDRGCNNGRSGGGGGGDNGVGAVRMGDTSDKSIFKGEVVAASTSSSPIEVVNGTNRRPPTLEPVGKEKPAGGGHLGGIGVGSGRVGGGIEVNPPRGASRPAHSLYAEVPPGTNRAASAGETRGPREEDGGDIVGTNRTRVIVAEAAAGRNGGASTAAVTTARPGCTTNHSFDGEVSRTSDSNAYRPSPSNSTTAVVEHKSPRHRQEPALRTSSMAFGATGGELCGELAPEREGSRAARLTAIAVTDAIIGGAVATAIAAQPGVADFGRWL